METNGKQAWARARTAPRKTVGNNGKQGHGQDQASATENNGKQWKTGQGQAARPGPAGYTQLFFYFYSESELEVQTNKIQQENLKTYSFSNCLIRSGGYLIQPFKGFYMTLSSPLKGPIYPLQGLGFLLIFIFSDNIVQQIDGTKKSKSPTNLPDALPN